jgi:hypothetical protein
VPDTLHICFGATLPRTLPGSGGAQWAYIGLDANRREQASTRLGEALRRDLGEEINRAAYRIRAEFQAWTAELAQAQRDPHDWWGSVTATRSPLLSDLFLHLSYLEVVRGWLANGLAEAPAIVVAEDAALWTTLAVNLRGQPRVTLHGAARPARWRRAARVAVRAQLARLYFAGRAARLRLEACLRVRQQPSADAPQVLLLTPIAASSFGADGNLAEPFHGRLADVLERNGERVTCLTGLTFPSRLVRRLPPFAERVIVLPRYTRARDIAACALARHRLEAPPHLRRFRDWNLTPLLRREVEETRSRTGYLQSRLAERAMRRVAAQFGGHAKALVYLAENQEWEQPMLRAWRSASPRTRLVAHKSYPMRPLLLGEFPAPGERGWRLRPDVALVCGEQSRALALAAGAEPDDVVVGGALRFSYLWHAAPRRRTDAGPTGDRTVAVLLPYSRQHAGLVTHELCLALRRPLECAGGGRARFLIKPHPLTAAAVRDAVAQAHSAWIAVTHEPARRLMQHIDAVLHIPGTSAGWEAAALGIPTIRYLTDFLDLDCYEPWANPLPACNRRNLRSRVAGILADAAPPPAGLRDAMFAPASAAAWSAAITGSPARDRAGTRAAAPGSDGAAGIAAARRLDRPA